MKLNCYISKDNSTRKSCFGILIMTFDIPKYGHLTGSFMEYAKRLTIDIHIFKMKVITLSLAYKKRKPFLTKKQVRKALKEMDQNL